MLAQLLLLLFVVTPQLFFSLTCLPRPGTSKENCLAKLDACLATGVRMKWSGIGCRKPNGDRYQDGGCQCGGYCGYNCADSCNKDSECFWNQQTKECWGREYQYAGWKMDTCDTMSPTSFAPTPPTTNTPTLMPTVPPTKEPTLAPTKLPTMQPVTSLAPTKLPTNLPTLAPTRLPISKSPTKLPTQPYTGDCKPMSGVSRSQCEAKLSRCAAEGRPMKWALGGTCGSACQCSKFCGYLCKAECNNDPLGLCTWVSGQCTYKATGLPGGPMPNCAV